MRIVPPTASGSPSESRRCKKDGCKGSTRDGKPYCPIHVRDATYPRSLLDELRRRSEEVILLLKSKEISKDGHLVREAMLLLAWTSCTERRLGRMLDIPHRAVVVLVAQLKKAEQVNSTKTPRGSVIVELNLPDLTTDP